MNNFQKNLRILANTYTQKFIADKTGFSQSSINNYLTKNSEPSIQFLVALNSAFNISIDEFLFSDIAVKQDDTKLDKYIGNYIVYYFNNSYYKGEVHNNYKNTLSYGVVSILRENFEVKVYAQFTKERKDAINILKNLNALGEVEILKYYLDSQDFYCGNIINNEQNIFINIFNKFNNDTALFIFNNPPSVKKYLGGLGTVSTIARGREHNPCVQYLIMSRKLVSRPDGEIYKLLSLNNYKVNLDYAIKDIIELLKRLYLDSNDISQNLTEMQKNLIIQNELEYHFNEILESNSFRFNKISNREDDSVYKIIKEGSDV